ncbi:MAG: hypothetical protein PVH88_27480 [Ignavibacteria bacterium]|jgi:hypothetical protein
MRSELDKLLKKNVDENEIELYSLLGLVTIRFAKLESKLTELLSTLIHPDDSLLSATLTEDIFLFKTIELIEKVGRIRILNDKKIKEIVSSANSLRKERNYFIHGDWEVKSKINGSVKAVCYRPKITFKQNETTKLWKRGFTSKIYTSDTLRKTAIVVEALTNNIKKLIDEIKDDPEFLD